MTVSIIDLTIIGESIIIRPIMKEPNLQQPVTGKEFFDREEILEKLIEGKQNIALIGTRKAGKTSLLRQFLTTQRKYIASYYYIPFEETLFYFNFNFFNSIVTAYLKFKNKFTEIGEETPKGQFNQLLLQLRLAKPDLTDYLAELRGLEGQGKGKGYLRGVISAFLELPYLLVKDEKKEFVVVLDEFQNVAVFNSLVPDVLRQKIQEKKGVYYYLAGSEVGLMEEMISRHKTPLFGHFTNFRVGYFSYEDARQFALAEGKERGLIINEGLLNFLVSLTGGFPFYVRILIYELSDVLVKEKREFVEKRDIINILRKNLFSQQGRLYKHFEETLDINLRRKRSGRFYQILKAIAAKPIGISEIANLTGIRVTSIPTYIDGLLKTELIAKKDSKYFVKDTLTRFWLNAGLGLQESSILDTEKKLETFNQKTKELFESLKAELGIAREAQIREIFILSGKYQRVRGGHLNGQELDVIAEGEKGYLLGEIKTKNVVKEDVKKFLEKIKKTRVKAKRKVFVVLMGIEKEARILAKAKRVEIWGLEKVNQERQKYKLTPLKL